MTEHEIFTGCGGYSAALYDRMKHKFPGLERIDENYSQAWQDLFVLSVLDGKPSGTFLEFGAGPAVWGNNTQLLEQFGYRGFSFEIDPRYQCEWQTLRPRSQFVCVDAVKEDLGAYLSHLPAQIEYVQLDIDTTENSLLILQRLLFSGHRFSVLTVETDIFAGGESEKLEIKTLLNEQGYQLLVENVGVLNKDWTPFEDWYVDPNFISADILDKFRHTGKKCVTLPEVFFV